MYRRYVTEVIAAGGLSRSFLALRATAALVANIPFAVAAVVTRWWFFIGNA
jgi:hypothetical protein